MAVMLLYMISVLSLIEAIIFGGIGFALLIPVVGQVGGAFGVANDSKIGYGVAILFPLLAVGLTTYLVVRHHAVNAGVVITFITYIALLALLLHTQSREYARIWFR